ncbi:MAG: hypothetical protein KKG59_04665 [Nanoarchaeota archaeon]|nr:hypothetical protein [Nanoarchaeota archaeon]
MNGIAHFFLTYFVLSFFVYDLQKFVIPVFILSIILDIDHIPGLIRELKLSTHHWEGLNAIKNTRWVRTGVEEPIGIITIEAILATLLIYGVHHPLIPIAMFCIAFHWLVDFLTVNTAPFTPVSRHIVNLFFKTRRSKVTKEVIITLAGGILFFLAHTGYF